MIPVLYKESEAAFTSNGIGRLSDVLECTVHEELNGVFELSLTVPEDGAFAKELTERRFIKAKPDDVSAVQPFRVYGIDASAGDGTVTVKAQHRSYDLNGIPVSGFTATGIVPALTGLKNNSLVTNPFNFWTDISNTTSVYHQTAPASCRACLGGIRGSILDTFGGEYEWNNDQVKLHARRGSDKGITIRYGKNLTDFHNERTNEDFYTGCLAYYEDDNDVITGEIQYIEDAADYPFDKIFTLDASDDFDDPPTVEQLNNTAAAYITNNRLGLPFKDTLEVDFVPLWQTTEYEEIAGQERISLGDTVHVIYKNYNVAMRVIEYEYDVIAEKYISITLGTKKATLQETISKPIETEFNTSLNGAVDSVMQSLMQATELLTGGLGGYIVMNRAADGSVNEILAMDTPNKETAVNVLRINMNGLGFSTTGYNGPFTNYWTINGELSADAIRTGQLDGGLIRAASILASALEVNAYNAVNGTIENVTFDGEGMHIARKNEDGTFATAYQSLFTELGMRVLSTSTGEATLTAEGDSVEAANLTAQTFLKISTDVTQTGTTTVYQILDRFQGFWSNAHNAPMVAVFWELT